jgi:hypothetical protein
MPATLEARRQARCDGRHTTVGSPCSEIPQLERDFALPAAAGGQRPVEARRALSGSVFTMSNSPLRGLCRAALLVPAAHVCVPGPCLAFSLLSLRLSPHLPPGRLTLRRQATKAWRTGSRTSRSGGFAPPHGTPLPAPPSGSSPETPLMSEDGNLYSIASRCSQQVNTSCSRQSRTPSPRTDERAASWITALNSGSPAIRVV